MKKYFIGMLALVLAIGFSAFTSPKKSVNKKYLFSIAANNTTSASGVQTLTNWVNQGELDVDAFVSCDDAQRDQACELIVDENDTEMVGIVRKLKASSVAIIAGQVGGSTHYVITSLTVSTPVSNPEIDRDL